MLVAEKQEQVYYPQQNLHTALPKGELREYPRTAPTQKTKSQVKPKSKGKVLPILLLMIIFSLACLTITRYAVISQNHQEIIDMKDTLQHEQNRQQNLRVELAERGNLNRIEKAAKEDLGMDYPTKDQVQAVKLPDGGSDVAVEIQNVQPLKKTIFEYIVNIFN